MIRQAYAAKYIDAADTWLKMIGDHNLMRQAYDFAQFETVIKTIAALYLPLLEQWYEDLLKEINT